MPEDKIFAVLNNPKALLEAYAASSAGVMRLAFERNKDLQAFRGRKDLAPAILERLTGLRPPGDPVVTGAHLYALELTGARTHIARAVAMVLKGIGEKDPHLVGQLAGFTGAALLRPEGARHPATPGRVPALRLKRQELDEILKAVEREEGPK